MDTYQGQQFEPISLHKYLYVHSSPIVNIDPTGHMSMAEVSTGMRVATQLVTSAIRISFAAARLQATAEFVATGVQIAGFIGSGQLSDAIGEAMKSTASSGSSLRDLSIDDAVASLMRHTHDLVTLSLAEWTKYLTPRAGQIEGFGIYLPQTAGGYAEFSGLKFGKHRVKFILDGKGKGRLTGLGVILKNKRKAKQIWRMDYHPLHSNANTSKSARYIVDRQFHYHINKAPKK